MRIEKLFSVEDRSAVVTGGASGLGLAIAGALAENGAKVTIVDISEDAVASAVAKLGPHVAGEVADITDRAALDRIFDGVAERHGGLDILFANAGISGGPGFALVGSDDNSPGAIDRCPDEEWDAVIRVNLDGTRKTLAAGARVMKANGRGGKIIITSSCAGLVNVPFVSTAYHASKAAVAHLGRQLALELASYGIRVNIVSPASFATNLGGETMDDEKVRAIFAGSTALNRVADVAEIAGLALFLASDASSYVTGVDIPIDGGARIAGKS